MSSIKEALVGYINDLPDEKLEPILSLVKMLSNDVVYLERITENDLSPEELEVVNKARAEYINGDCIDFEEYLSQRE